MGKRKSRKKQIVYWIPPVKRIGTYRDPRDRRLLKIKIRRKKVGDKVITVGMVYKDGELIWKVERKGAIWEKPDIYNWFLDYLNERGEW